jgi:hypothetical protein
VTELARWVAHQSDDLDLLRRAVQVTVLPDNSRHRMQQQLAERQG